MRLCALENSAFRLLEGYAGEMPYKFFAIRKNRSLFFWGGGVFAAVKMPIRVVTASVFVHCFEEDRPKESKK